MRLFHCWCTVPFLSPNIQRAQSPCEQRMSDTHTAPMLKKAVSVDAWGTLHCPTSQELSSQCLHPQHTAVAFTSSIEHALNTFTVTSDEAWPDGAPLTTLHMSLPQHTMDPSAACIPHVDPVLPPSLISTNGDDNGSRPIFLLYPHALR